MKPRTPEGTFTTEGAVLSYIKYDLQQDYAVVALTNKKSFNIGMMVFVQYYPKQRVADSWSKPVGGLPQTLGDVNKSQNKVSPVIHGIYELLHEQN